MAVFCRYFSASVAAGKLYLMNMIFLFILTFCLELLNFSKVTVIHKFHTPGNHFPVLTLHKLFFAASEEIYPVLPEAHDGVQTRGTLLMHSEFYF